MRIIHTADLHLDAPCSANYSKEQAKTRRTELLNTFLRIVQYAAENQVSAILISGDLFDRKTISKTAANTVYKAVASHPEIVFFYLRGNHDEQGFPDSFSEIPKNLKLFGDSWTTYPLGERGTVTVTGAELSAGHPELYDELALAPEKVNLVMLHGQEAESAKSDAEAVSLRDLRNRFIDYLALGHVHSYKKAELDGRGVYVYPGCPEGRGFDECGEKGFVLIDIDEEERTVDSYFVPFAFRRLYWLHTDVTGAASTMEILSRVQAELQAEGVPDGASVRVSLVGSFDAEEEKDPALVEESLKDRFEVFEVRDETMITVDYSKYALDLSLKGEFIRLVKQKDLPEEEKALIIRTGLAALSGEVEAE